MSDQPDYFVAFEAAEKKLSVMLDDMRNGALSGCDPTWAADLAANTHEAITAINEGVKLVEHIAANPVPLPNKENRP